MSRFDLRIYFAHAVFWLTFAAGGLAARFRFRQAPAASTPRVEAPAGAVMRAPRANLLIGLHMAAFAVMYTGVGRAVFQAGMPATLPVVKGLGALMILIGGAVLCWARLAFASWRFRAQLDAGHQLATGGPFRFVRHPIYTGLDLLALGTALWMPTVLVWLGAVLMAVVGELRARAEEALLERAFGDAYRNYRRQTKRFIPGVY